MGSRSTLDPTLKRTWIGVHSNVDWPTRRYTRLRLVTTYSSARHTRTIPGYYGKR
jgi:hypothetical protein